MHELCPLRRNPSIPIPTFCSFHVQPHPKCLDRHPLRLRGHLPTQECEVQKLAHVDCRVESAISFETASAVVYLGDLQNCILCAVLARQETSKDIRVLGTCSVQVRVEFLTGQENEFQTSIAVLAPDALMRRHSVRLEVIKLIVYDRLNLKQQ